VDLLKTLQREPHHCRIWNGTASHANKQADLAGVFWVDKLFVGTGFEGRTRSRGNEEPHEKAENSDSEHQLEDLIHEGSENRLTGILTVRMIPWPNQIKASLLKPMESPLHNLIAHTLHHRRWQRCFCRFDRLCRCAASP